MLAFISEKRAIKLIVNNKVEIVSNWIGRKITSGNGSIAHPATLKMKRQIVISPTKLTFSRKLIFRRDKYMCGYCGARQKQNNLTIDHVIPKSIGGKNSFTNCITACLQCNRGKSNRTPEQAGMTLKIDPTVPNRYLAYFPSEIEYHDDWLFFVGN